MQTSVKTPLNTNEKRAISGLASLYGLRMLGLFMVLPVMPIFLRDYPGAAPLLIGLTIGIYGLTQAVLQIPFGWLSDKFGRKPLIYFGLAIFALGSCVAALADSIYIMLLGRALQGAGAIASVLMALLADLTRDEKRTQAMASVGISIGMAFIVAMTAGPLLAGFIGLAGLFWLTAIFSVLGILVVKFYVPNPAKQSQHLDAGINKSQLAGVLLNPQLLRLDFSILILHLILTAMFVALPQVLLNFGFGLTSHSFIYLATMLGGFVLMIPLIIIGETKGKMKNMLLISISLLIAGLSLVAANLASWVLIAALLVFFIGFNLLEASLPSLISKQAPVVAKGTAMGVYSTSQFLGAFLGGFLAGSLLTFFSANLLFLALAGLAFIWLLVILGYQQPAILSTQVFTLGLSKEDETNQLTAELRQLAGVAEVALQLEEARGYLKIDRSLINQEDLNQLLAKFNPNSASNE